MFVRNDWPHYIHSFFVREREKVSIPWSRVDFEYSSNCGPRIRKFDNNTEILSGLHWPMDTESATFSTNVISSSTVNNLHRKRSKKLIPFSYLSGRKNILVCSSYAGVARCICRFAFDFSGRGASKFFKDRFTWDIVPNFVYLSFFVLCN